MFVSLLLGKKDKEQALRRNLSTWIKSTLGAKQTEENLNRKIDFRQGIVLENKNGNKHYNFS